MISHFNFGICLNENTEELLTYLTIIRLRVSVKLTMVDFVCATASAMTRYFRKQIKHP